MDSATTHTLYRTATFIDVRQFVVCLVVCLYGSLVNWLVGWCFLCCCFCCVFFFRVVFLWICVCVLFLVFVCLLRHTFNSKLHYINNNNRV